VKDITNIPQWLIFNIRVILEAVAAAPKKGKASALSQPVVQSAQIVASPDKKIKRKKDPNAPKKPMSAFFCFQMARRQALKGEAPDLNHKDIIKVSYRIIIYHNLKRSRIFPSRPICFLLERLSIFFLFFYS